MLPDAVITADVLQALAAALIGFSVYLFTLRGFYALQDTRTPFLVNLFENGANIVLALALYPAFGVQGLALAYAGAYSLAAVVALALLYRRVGDVLGGALATAARARPWDRSRSQSSRPCSRARSAVTRPRPRPPR